ncbi:glycosyltransferase family 25 protein [Aeromonas allosaccharophila]|uniref:glycosyltransferase family 25 protein n=1 Tax=Aeromonas allosaccharophila TaxID=656 RepID=UPI003D20F2FC
MKKIVVSLKNSERRENFDKLFSELGHQYFDAIVPQDNDPRFDQFIAQSLYGRELRRGEVGCTLSHFEIIKNFSQSVDDSRWLLIMEDDALPEPQFQQFIDDFSKECCQLSENPLVILLGHSKTSKKHLFVQGLKQPLANRITFSGHIFGQNKHVTRCGTICYLINKTAATTLSKPLNPYWLADEWALYSNLGVVVYHPIKPLVYEDLSYASATQNEVKYQHDFISRPLANIVHILIGRYHYYREMRKN